ncbi:MAG: hypothetical protein AABY26_02145 [Nanoarchaeota archaeon]
MNKLQWIIFVGLLFMGLFLLASCTKTVDWSPQTCVKDSDCVPTTCCHANESVNKESAPNCTSQFCTSECVPDTLDCGQGNLQCISGKCQITIMKSLNE